LEIRGRPASHLNPIRFGGVRSDFRGIDYVSRCRDSGNRRALRRAQVVRKQRLNVYNRGNRMWTSREKPAQVVLALPGQSWTMYFTADSLGDLHAVSKYISIKSA